MKNKNGALSGLAPGHVFETSLELLAQRRPRSQDSLIKERPKKIWRGSNRMGFWFETDLRVGQHRDSSLKVEVPSDDWVWCANPIEHRRLPRGFSRRVSDII